MEGQALTSAAPTDWPGYLTSLLRDLAEARWEEVTLKKSMAEARVHVIAENHPQRWQYDNAMAATTQDLAGELLDIQCQIAERLEALNLAKTLFIQQVPFTPNLNLRWWADG